MDVEAAAATVALLVSLESKHNGYYQTRIDEGVKTCCMSLTAAS